MNRPNDPTSNPTPIEPTVLGADGRVIFSPDGTEKTEDAFGGSIRMGAGRTTVRRVQLGFFSKLFFGLFFGALLFVGLAAAGILLGIFLVGLLAKMTFSSKPRRMKR